VEGWKQRDPIKTLGEKLDTLGYKAARENIDRTIEEEIMDAVRFAEESSFPALDTATDYVYA